MSRIDQNMTAADDAFVEQAGSMLREGADTLDANTRSRLNKARQKALLELSERSRIQRWFADQWVPAVSAAFVMVLAAGLWLGIGMQTQSEVESPQITVAPAVPRDLTDLDVLLADESLEMIEDLEFYSWMDSELTTEMLEAELEAAG